MRKIDRPAATHNNTAMTAAQRAIAALVRTLRRAQRAADEAAVAAAASALADALVTPSSDGVTMWGPFGAYFITSRCAGAWWVGVAHRETTLMVNRNAILTVRVPNGTLNGGGPRTVTVHPLPATPWGVATCRRRCGCPLNRVGRRWVLPQVCRNRAARRDRRDRAVAAAAEARRRIAAATPAQRAAMYALATGQGNGGGVPLAGGARFDGGRIACPDPIEPDHAPEWIVPAHAAVLEGVPAAEAERTLAAERAAAERAAAKRAERAAEAARIDRIRRLADADIAAAEAVVRRLKAIHA